MSMQNMNIKERRNKLVGLMIIDICQIVISVIVDSLLLKYYKIYDGKYELTTLSVVLMVVARVVQYNSVNTFVDYILYWPHRHIFKEADLYHFEGEEMNDISIF